MIAPELLTTPVYEAVYGGVAYRIAGPVVPVLQVELQETPVYFEHHSLLWKEPAVQVGLKPLKGAFQRFLAGMPILMTEAKGPGRITFSRDAVGHVFPIHLRAGDGFDVREHQFLAATDAVVGTYTGPQRRRGTHFSSEHYAVDSFSCADRDGVLWLHGYGNVFELNLKAGEQVDVEPGGWVYKDCSVQMEDHFQNLAAGLVGATPLYWIRFTGPGRVGLQSLYPHYHLDRTER